VIDFHKEQREEGWYGIARWSREDVHLYREGMEWPKWSDEKAEEWLASIERSLQDRMTETGWEVIETLMEKE
jgi:hypothetical protein